MPCFFALARRRSAIALLSTTLALTTGAIGASTGSASERRALGGSGDQPCATTPAANTHGGDAPASTTPNSTPPAPTTPEPATPEPATPEATPAPPMAAPDIAAQDPGEASPTAGASRVTATSDTLPAAIPAPLLVPIAERIKPAKPGPSLRVVSAGKRLRAARLKTLNAKVDVAGAASLKAWIILPKAAAKATGTGLKDELTLARLSIRQPPSGRILLKFQFDGPAQEALLRFYKVTLHVRVAATDAKGNVTTVDQTIALSD